MSDNRQNDIAQWKRDVEWSPNDSLGRSILNAIESGKASGVLARTIRQRAATWGVPRLPALVTFRFNGRLRTTIARWVIKSQCLEVGGRFMELEGGHLEILLHELAHAAAVIKYGVGVRPHGPEWRTLVHEAGFQPNARRTLHGSVGKAVAAASKPSASLYEHRCLVCHAVRYARKPMASWRCVECASSGLNGKLAIRGPQHPGKIK